MVHCNYITLVICKYSTVVSHQHEGMCCQIYNQKKNVLQYELVHITKDISYNKNVIGVSVSVDVFTHVHTHTHTN